MEVTSLCLVGIGQLIHFASLNVFICDDDHRIVIQLFVQEVNSSWGCHIIVKLHCDRLLDIGDALAVTYLLLLTLQLSDLVSAIRCEVFDFLPLGRIVSLPCSGDRLVVGDSSCTILVCNHGFDFDLVFGRSGTTLLNDKLLAVLGVELAAARANVHLIDA